MASTYRYRLIKFATRKFVRGGLGNTGHDAGVSCDSRRREGPRRRGEGEIAGVLRHTHLAIANDVTLEWQFKLRGGSNSISVFRSAVVVKDSVVLQLAFDEAGIHPGSKAVVLAGFVGDVRRWKH
jgi:hypothetical protein